MNPGICRVAAMLVTFAIGVALVLLCGSDRLERVATQQRIPDGWYRINAGNYFSFYLPQSIQFVSGDSCFECSWGSTYSSDQIWLHATSTDWEEEYAPEYYLGLREFKREFITISGRTMRIQSWRMAEPFRGYNYYVQVRLYDPKNGSLTTEMVADCKTKTDVKFVTRIAKTINFP